jgi:hypothetical protein
MATTQAGTSGATGTRTSTTGGTQGGIGGKVSDTTYSLISVMYHTLQGCQTYEKYAQDAEQAGQQEIAQFFRETGRQFEQCAEHGKRLLAQCLQQGNEQGQGSRGQLNSQMGGASGQQGQSGTSSGQQGSARSSSNMGSGSANLSGSSSRSNNR